MIRNSIGKIALIVAALAVAVSPRSSTASDDVMLPFEVRLQGLAFPVPY